MFRVNLILRGSDSAETSEAVRPWSSAAMGHSGHHEQPKEGFCLLSAAHHFLDAPIIIDCVHRRPNGIGPSRVHKYLGTARLERAEVGIARIHGCQLFVRAGQVAIVVKGAPIPCGIVEDPILPEFQPHWLVPVGDIGLPSAFIFVSQRAFASWRIPCNDLFACAWIPWPRIYFLYCFNLGCRQALVVVRAFAQKYSWIEAACLGL